jgi:FMN-dependent NADH-azoreductase
MSSVLLLTSSPRAGSLSTTIAVDLADKIKAQNPGSVIVRRDLASNPLPHIDRKLQPSRFPTS